MRHQHPVPEKPFPIGQRPGRPQPAPRRRTAASDRTERASRWTGCFRVSTLEAPRERRHRSAAVSNGGNPGAARTRVRRQTHRSARPAVGGGATRRVRRYRAGNAHMTRPARRHHRPRAHGAHRSDHDGEAAARTRPVRCRPPYAGGATGPARRPTDMGHGSRHAGAPAGSEARETDRPEGRTGVRGRRSHDEHPRKRRDCDTNRFHGH